MCPSILYNCIFSYRSDMNQTHISTVNSEETTLHFVEATLSPDNFTSINLGRSTSLLEYRSLECTDRTCSIELFQRSIRSYKLIYLALVIIVSLIQHILILTAIIRLKTKQPYHYLVSITLQPFIGG